MKHITTNTHLTRLTLLTMAAISIAATIGNGSWG
jgi:hypothetical protein